VTADAKGMRDAIVSDAASPVAYPKNNREGDSRGGQVIESWPLKVQEAKHDHRPGDRDVRGREVRARGAVNQ
jgi:hypothetical protein